MTVIRLLQSLQEGPSGLVGSWVCMGRNRSLTGLALGVKAGSGVLGAGASFWASWVVGHESTQGLSCSSFLVMTYFLSRDYNILPKKELHWSPWVLSQWLL